MRDRDRLTAERFGILDKVEALERELLQVDRVVGVEFDLDGFYSDIYQVIVIPEYDIPVNLPDYFDVRKRMLNEVLAVTRSHGLNPSGDTIEDYGKHYYIVRDCDNAWKELVQQKKDTMVVAGRKPGVPERNLAEDTMVVAGRRPDTPERIPAEDTRYVVAGTTPDKAVPLDFDSLLANAHDRSQSSGSVAGEKKTIEYGLGL